MWPLQCIQGFSKIWPSDLDFDPTWPIFKPIQDITKANILSNFKRVLNKRRSHNSVHMVFLRFNQVTQFLTPHDPFSNATQISLRQTFWPTFKSIRQKMWLLELTQGFSKIWPSDLVFHPSWPIFKLVRNIIKENILSNFQEHWTENMAYTRFFLDLTWWPSFWPNMAHFHTLSRHNQDKHSDHFSKVLIRKCGLYSVQKVYLRFDLMT